MPSSVLDHMYSNKYTKTEAMSIKWQQLCILRLGIWGRMANLLPRYLIFLWTVSWTGLQFVYRHFV